MVYSPLKRFLGPKETDPVKLALVATLALFAGAVLGVMLTGERSTRLGATLGLVIGAQAGACLAVESAAAAGDLTPAAADRALAGAVRQLRRYARLESATGDWLGDRGDCARAVARLASLEGGT